MAFTILLVRDDLATPRGLRLALVPEGHQVQHTPSGLGAMREALLREPDLLILGMDSRIDDCKFLRRLLTPIECPVLVLLSAKDKLACTQSLDLGADDCMAEPLALVELIARVPALLRRGQSTVSRRERACFVDGDLVVDLTRREVRRDDEPLSLTPTEYLIQACLVQQQGEVLSPQQLAAQVWGPHAHSSGDALRQYIHHLRHKLEPDPARVLRTVTRRRGGHVLRRIEGKG